MIFHSLLLFAALYTTSEAISFEQWKAKHGMVMSPVEELRRRAIFMDNAHYVNEVNTQQSGFVCSLDGPFSAMTNEEYNALLNPITPSQAETVTKAAVANSDDKGIDYRQFEGRSFVTKVKNQGSCASCYAFASVAALETSLMLSHRELDDESAALSVGDVLSCSFAYGNKGCQGGLITSTYQYMSENGISSDKDFPYHAKDTTCYNTRKVAKVDKYKTVRPEGGLSLIHI